MKIITTFIKKLTTKEYEIIKHKIKNFQLNLIDYDDLNSVAIIRVMSNFEILNHTNWCLFLLTKIVL